MSGHEAPTPSTAGQAIAASIHTATRGITYTTEDELQAQIATAIPYDVIREAPLSDGHSRIDMLWIGRHATDQLQARVGIEVKIAGSLATVERQLTRYANCPEIDELVLVTTKAAHHRIPTHLGARRVLVHLVSMVENGL